ncbi:class I SAM-dependent methyltransferase [Methylibium sp.]|uniref:class I SAM-dependent methyltransferase n=1 Tax=Methylibium sp. TaxID=2067992 RepID=UPI003D0D0C20
MPGYQTQTQILAVGGVRMKIRSLLDRRQFFDPQGEAERAGISSAAWPLFGMVWPSALVLAAQMEHIPLGTRSVLELGCGLALASLVVQRRRGQVTASDHHPLAEDFLLENLRLNALPALHYERGDWSAVNPALGRFDLIIGSDILYERGQPRLLSEFIERHSRDVAEVMIVDPDRGNRSQFNQHMQKLGFERSERRITQLPEGAAYKGRVLSYLRSARPVA